MWIKLTASEESWRSVEMTKHKVDVLIDSDSIFAMKGIVPHEEEGNKTVLFIKAVGPDGWLEINVAETIDEVFNLIGARP